MENREEAAAGLEAEDLGDSTAGKGPVLDQDPGPVQDPESRERTGRGSRKERVGRVVSDAPEKTVTVSVEGPPGFTGRQPINVGAFYDDTLAGGVTLIATAGA